MQRSIRFGSVSLLLGSSKLENLKKDFPLQNHWTRKPAMIPQKKQDKIRRLKTVPDDFTGMFFPQRPAVLAVVGISKAHAAHTDRGDGQNRISRFRVLHGKSSLIQTCILLITHSFQPFIDCLCAGDLHSNM